MMVLIWLRRGADLGVTIAVGAALTGHLLRDRVLLLAALTYLPLTLIGLVAAGYDVVRGGRTWGDYRLAGVSFFVGLWALTGMVGWRSAPPADGPRPSIRVVLQNAWWGGGPWRSTEAWDRTLTEVTDGQPNLLMFSEAPIIPWFGAFVQERKWSMDYVQYGSEDPYWFRLVVLSPWPHRAATPVELPDGSGLLVEVDHPEGPIRIAMVDGRSSPLRDRVLFLDAVSDLLRRQAEGARTIDILAGDFNAPARSVGFDAIRRDYWLVSETCGQWRGTWPRWLPLIDVDHIWVRRGWTAKECEIFSITYGDHRGVTAVLE